MRTITETVKKVPQWKHSKDGFSQLKLVAQVLDGEDIFCSMETGGGKSMLCLLSTPRTVELRQ
jgi:superfamily II DNA helicase RecQ